MCGSSAGLRRGPDPTAVDRGPTTFPFPSSEVPETLGRVSVTMSERRAFSLASVGRSAFFLAGSTALVQVIGLLRETYLAAEVGVSARLDALIVGLALPLVVSFVLTSGPRTAMVPTYLDLRRDDPRGARRVAGIVITWVAIVGALASLVLFACAGPFVDLTGPGLDGASREAGAGYLRIVAGTTFIICLQEVLWAVCQAEELFPQIAVAQLTGPLVTLIIMFALWDTAGLDGLAWGSVAGPTVSLAFLLVAVARRGMLPIPGLFARGLGLAPMLHHALPLTVSASILPLNAIIDRAIASLVAPGAISALRYGDSLVKAPIAAISPAWGSAVYPALVRSRREEGVEVLAVVAGRTLRYTVAAFMPIAFLTAAVAPIAVSTLYGRGQFDQRDQLLVSQVLALFAPLIVTLMAQQVVVASLNAQRRGIVLLAAGVLQVALNTVFDLMLGFTLGVLGIALASTLATGLVVVFQFVGLRRSGLDIPVRPLVRGLALAAGAALPVSLAIAALSWWGPPPADTVVGVVLLLVYGGAGLFGYVGVAIALGYREPRTIAEAVTHRALRLVPLGRTRSR